MNNFQTLFSSFSPDNHIRGGQFEVICKWFLENDPHYSLRLEKVWYWNDWPGRWGADCGIDLVAKDSDGKVWAIQAKCYDSSYSVTKHDVDKFLSESVNEKIDYRLLIATTDQIGENSRKVIHRQNEVIPVSMVLLNDLEQAPLVWPSSVDALDSGHTVPKATPRPHQTEAIEASASNLVDRGQMIMACGTGKTLTALWIAEKLESKRTLVLLPSLLLLSKTLSEWVAHANDPFAYLPVCSDETVTRGADTVMSSTSDLAFPSTTDKDDISRFLREPGNRVVFSTYQSSPKIAEAFKQGNVPAFDLVIADEAHRCAGKVASEYGTVLDEKAIPARRRLFMTATPRVYTPHLMKAAADSGIDVASMDDEAVFGRVLHRLTFGQAIDKNLLSDYQVVVVGIDDPTYQQMVADRSIVETETGIRSDARSLASHVGLAKAMDRYDLRRVITFHSRVNWASEFARDLSEVIGWMPEQYRPSGEITCSYVSGDMSTSLRNQRLASLADLELGQRAVLSNAKCLSEGVDVPALDGVAFIDPKKSEIAIVQAVGRAIRLSPEKLKGTIIIPVFISDGNDPDTVLKSSEFDKVWKVVNALRAHDDALGEELDSLRTLLGRIGSTTRPTKILFEIPTRIDRQFAAAFDTRLLEATTESWCFWFGLLQAYVEQNGHARPPRPLTTNEGFALGGWVENQRKMKDKLSPNRKSRLESLQGWLWDSKKAEWEKSFGYLEAFVKEVGHARVPSGSETHDGFALGSWVKTQRKMRDKLSPECIARLESLSGWVWDDQEAKWLEGIEYLEAFVNKFGYAGVDPGLETHDGFTLGSWVKTQRKMRDKLSPECIARLESLPGWDWRGSKARWEQSFEYLEAFVKEVGHARVPSGLETHDGFALGSWVKTQRKMRDKLSPECIARFESLSAWEWTGYEDQWEQGFEHLKAFVKDAGHTRVPPELETHDGSLLGSWVKIQRKMRNKLSTDRIARLESLSGWIWDDQEVEWLEGVGHLEAFVNQFGYAGIEPGLETHDGFALGSWVGQQRAKRSTLSPERQALLEALPGWVWKLRQHYM